jgi:putative FmdB family regulatory protein
MSASKARPGSFEMPIYEYRCQKCGQHLEVIQRFSDRPLSSCKSCGGPLTKLISQSSFRLKGSGWYLTDYARKGARPDGKKEASKPAASDSPDEGAKEKSAKGAGGGGSEP